MTIWRGFVELDRILRGEATRPAKLEQGAVQIPLFGIFGAILILAVVYGFCMGMFALIRGFENGVPWPGIFQAMASMSRVPLLYLMTLLVTFPSLYVFNAIIGSQLRIVSMLKLLVASMGVNIAVLASLGPIVIFFSLSTPNYPFVVMLNVVVLGPSDSIRLHSVLLQVLAWGPIDGFAMGCYGWCAGSRTFVEQLPQMLISGVKVPILIALTLVISLPGFYVINTLLGLRDDFRTVLTAILQTQTGVMILLASFAPLPLVFYTALDPGSPGYSQAIMFNAMLFGTASVSAQLILRRRYRPLIARNRWHRPMLILWLLLYAFVGIQVDWTLRPFIGSPNQPTSFFRPEPLANAYVEVFGIIKRAFGN